MPVCARELISGKCDRSEATSYYTAALHWFIIQLVESFSVGSNYFIRKSNRSFSVGVFFFISFDFLRNCFFFVSRFVFVFLAEIHMWTNITHNITPDTMTLEWFFSLVKMKHFNMILNTCSCLPHMFFTLFCPCPCTFCQWFFCSSATCSLMEINFFCTSDQGEWKKDINCDEKEVVSKWMTAYFWVNTTTNKAREKKNQKKERQRRNEKAANILFVKTSWHS